MSNDDKEIAKISKKYGAGIPFIMPKERSIDIDDKIDFKLAKIVMEKSKGKK